MTKKTNKNKKQSKSNNQIAPYLGLIIVLVTIVFSIIGLLDFGLIGRLFNSVFRVLFGQYPQIFFLIIIAGCIIWILFHNQKKLDKKQIIAFVLLFMALELGLVIFSGNQLKGGAVFDHFFKNIDFIFDRSVASEGGFFGALLYSLFSLLFDKTGSILVMLLFILIALILLQYDKVNKFQESIWNKEHKPKKLVTKSRKLQLKEKTDVKKFDRFEADEMQEFEPVDMAQAIKNEKSIFIDANEIKEPVKLSNKVDEDLAVKPLSSDKEFVNYTLPSLTLLDSNRTTSRSSSNVNSAQQKGERLVQLLQQFGIETTLIGTHIGPAVTKFELKLDTGVKVSRIASLQDNIMMELAVKEIRIEAPIPGRNAVGVEIPNVEMTPVRLLELLKEIPEKLEDEKLLVALGKNLMGRNIFGTLNRMPHLLVAGATGSGKSVCINSMIATLLLRTKPNEVKLLLIDPKKVEFQVFNDIPHLIAPVVNDAVSAAKALNVIVKIMDQRYDVFAENGARNISGYNELATQNLLLKPMPNIIVIIDELADLMAVAGKEVEASIQRITQLARAAGIHLVVATQRPSVDVITGVIKANIPSRIGFAVSSGTDSRTILDSTGAERLLGYGDMLYQPFGEPHPQRLQGVFISDEEVQRIATETKNLASPMFDDAFMNLDGAVDNSGFVETSEDPLFDEVKEYVITEQKASTSLLQRRFGIGYNRAARMIDALEDSGVIGPIQGSRPRDVYIKPKDIDTNQEEY